MKKLLSIFSIIIILCFSVFAQNDDEKGEVVECPTVVIMSPPAAVKPGETLTFTVKVSGGNQNLKKIKYVWSVDNGKIVEGQGTKEISVSTDGLGDTTVTATLAIDGLMKECESVFSDTGIVSDWPPCEIIDEFGPLANDDLRNRMDNFLIALQAYPNMKGYIQNFGSKKETLKREKLIRRHLKLRKYDASRVEFINSGKEPSIRTKLWILTEFGVSKCLGSSVKK